EPLTICLEKVQYSDAVVLIVGFKAGSLIPESPELTYTRAEFELAQRLGKPVFPFFKTEMDLFSSSEMRRLAGSRLEIGPTVSSKAFAPRILCGLFCPTR